MDRDLPAPALNDLERAIIAQLQRDGRIPFRTLATQLGVTETTVYRHAQQLMDAGYFHVVGFVDPLQAGRGHAVLAGISCDPPAVHTVAAALAAIPAIRFAALATGTFDVACELVTADHAYMIRLLTDILPTIPGVRALNTSWVLHTYFTHFLWDQHADRAEPPYALDHGADTAPPRGGHHDEPAASEIVLDDSDQAILHLLQQNGRISYADIAVQLGLTESTARRRTIRILQSGYVQVVAVSNPLLLGFQDVVLMWFKIDLARLPPVVAALSRLPSVRYLSRTAGSVDLVAEAYFPNHAALFAFLDGPLAEINGIREVSISVELVLIKRAFHRFDTPQPAGAI